VEVEWRSRDSGMGLVDGGAGRAKEDIAACRKKNGAVTLAEHQVEELKLSTNGPSISPCIGVG
jgi:hypothetical protein